MTHPQGEDDDGVRQPLLGDDADRHPPTAAAPAADPPGHHDTFAPTLGASAAYGILVSIVIGSGVFTSPGSIDTNVPSPGMALVMWLLGGVLAWAGASTLAELGTAIPGPGGVQPYLQYIYGELAGFLSAWTWIVAVMPSTMAILSIVFVESIYSAAGHTDRAGALSHKLMSVAVLAAVSSANCFSTRASTRLSGLSLAVKFSSIALVVAAAVAVVALQVRDPDRRDVGGRDWFDRAWFAARDSRNLDGSVTHWDGMGRWEMLGRYSAAVYAALWAYSGWDKAIYISSELRNPSKQLPLTINTALPTIFLCFLVANAAYYILLPWDLVSTSDSVAVTAISRLLGVKFGFAAAGMVCLVVAGTILGISLITGRMIVAAAAKGWLPGVFASLGRLGPRRRRRSRPAGSDAPVNAILLSVALAALYILLGDFRALLTFNGLGEYVFFLLTVVGAVVLRYREPGLHRPYRTPLAVPVLFAVVSGFVVVRGALFAPVQALVLVALWTAGVAVHFIRERWGASGPPTPRAADPS